VTAAPAPLLRVHGGSVADALDPAVVRELAQLNGGSIRIDESPLGGAWIEVRFPAT